MLYHRQNPREKPWVLTMDYRTVSKNATQFLALTSLHVGEFESLLAQFAPVCEKYFRYHTLEGKKRRIVTAKEHGHALKPWLASPPTRSGGMSIRGYHSLRRCCWRGRQQRQQNLDLYWSSLACGFNPGVLFFRLYPAKKLWLEYTPTYLTTANRSLPSLHATGASRSDGMWPSLP